MTKTVAPCTGATRTSTYVSALYRLGPGRCVANASCARRYFTDREETRFELEQQRPVTERVPEVQVADILAHDAPVALTNFLIEVSGKVLVGLAR